MKQEKKHMEETRVCTGVIGAGAISDIYLKNMITRFDNLQVKSICAAHMESAQKKAEKYGIQAVTMAEMLDDPEISLVVNLTPAHVHYRVIRAALEHGKHVYTEKILTDDLEKSRELVQLARERGLYLGSAPDTFMGAALQTARAAIDSGMLGEIHSFAVSANRCNEILLSMFDFLRQPGGGIVCDYAVYYVTALVSLLGPAARVGSIIGYPYPTHVNCIPDSPMYGQEMDTPNESQVNAVLQFENGVTGTLHIDADSVPEDQAYFTIYGTKGILMLTNPNQFGGEVRFLANPASPADWKKRNRQQPCVLPSVNEYTDNARGIGPSDLADTILNGTALRPSAEMAYHVHEILNAMLQGGTDGAFTEIRSSCKRPEV
ncbi:Gfo/Idh/MocA family oxidoreductase [Ruminococcus sp. CLA-AA-H200]|uniref:Gfo/Idh/MocA family oxidoreductase n=1 Tax=Ruminococcus turbiniformis TaxID=2881258 RepID=A0ABS8G0J7_9FIRM|nr:Gfo/Idh/MocA family oxidoreductase [Ruminococcus turbiniformis]MCC2255771.1 Gfo/Idh/MocA family oxidoreductase [Ruminococcus turbiniformis]